jgi:hypothetical protein
MKLAIITATVLSLLFSGTNAQTECATADCCAQTGTCPIGATEGPIQQISDLTPEEKLIFGDGGAKMKVVATTVIIPASTFAANGIMSGAGVTLDKTAFLSQNSLPGRDGIAGFLEGTAKCEVTDSDPDGALTGTFGAMVGRMCIIEAAENVMLALVTDKNAESSPGAGDCQLFIGDGFLELKPNTDPRYAFTTAVDAEGK